MKKILSFLILVIFISPAFTQAQELLQDINTTQKAVVIEVLDEENRTVPGTNMTHSYQTIKVSIAKGEDKGKEIIIENDYLNLDTGDKLYVRKTVSATDSSVTYNVLEPDRLPTLLILTIVFIGLIILLGGKQGVRGLISLIGSLVLIIFIFLPGLLKGISPIGLSIAVSSLIIVVGSYITHGFNRTTTSAVIGMIGTVIITSLIALYAVKGGHLSGYESDEAVYLSVNMGGNIDIVGLLLGGMLIGLLGILYDVAIGQAIFVEELYRADKHMTKKKAFERAIRMGREHIGALVNTLAIAYVGASLPILLLFFGSGDGDTLSIINREVFATEIVRTLVGGIGLILAVPATTICAIYLLHGRQLHTSEHSHSH